MTCKAGIPVALIVAALASSAAADNVAVSITVGQPGYYGQIDIGNYPPPQLIYSRPVVIVAAPMNRTPAPVYLRVPPGHAKNWRKHCGAYNACGQPVYFVSDHWYNRVYVPDYRKRHGAHDEGGNGNGRGNGGKPNKHGND